MKPEISYRKKNGKSTNTWRLNNMLLKNQLVSEEIKEEIRKYLETNENGNTVLQNLWNAAKAVLRGKFIVIQVFPQETRKKLKEPNLLSKGIRKRRINKAQSQQKGGNNKDQRGNK